MGFQFQATALLDAERALQRDVREFLRVELAPGSYRPGLGISSGSDPEFSRKLAARGWVGMALPKQYGGQDKTAVERFIVVEELLRWGAPVGHHWVADRQTGPLLAKFGTDQQKARFLPAICRGEVAICIGMSEPDSGSDLASLRTRATRVDGGWRVSGTKIWTSSAHLADWMLALCRTSQEDDRHAGLSQLLVDLRSPGITISPIPFLNGWSHFNEVSMRDVFVPDDLVLGEVGAGWAQNSSELIYERGGPDRWITPFIVVEHMLREARVDAADPAQLAVLGELIGRWWGLRQLSLSVARLIDAGAAPAAEAALVKEIGTRFEQEVVSRIADVMPLEPIVDSSSMFEQLLADAVLTCPSFTIRGGTTEVLRTVIARGLQR
jgi:alkylation response protein AidB-like acyl-CoA dehydrogenase